MDMLHDAINPIDVPRLSGDEEILNGVTVRDFWGWALSDLRLNANRGMLAQFLVALALEDNRMRDDGWGNLDVLSAEGIRVEVKSSGYLQSWVQRRLSSIVFGGLKARSWNAESGYSAEAEFRADVYVFAVHICKDPSVYDPLHVESWDFYVLPAEVVRNINQKTLNLARFQKFAPPAVKLGNLRSAVNGAYTKAASTP